MAQGTESPPSPLPRLLRVADVAEQFGISKQRVYEVTASGMPCIRFNSALYYDPAAIREWLAAGGTASKKKGEGG